jgi:uncharacterized membrane protein YdbT with pleckstrin-like domain
MGYVDKSLLPGENVVRRARVHRFIYANGLFWLIAGILVAVYSRPISQLYEKPDNLFPFVIIACVVMILVGMLKILNAWTAKLGTELAVTTRRVIAKVGLVRRDIVELNIDKVESIQVSQSVLGRILGFGTVVVRGTGTGQTPIPFIADPLGFRSAVSRQHGGG